MKEYKAIFLDWDDTIGDFSGAAYCSLQHMYEQHGLADCYESFEQFFEIYETHNLDLWRRYGLDEVTKHYLEFDRMFYPLMMAPRAFESAKAIPLAVHMGQEHLENTTKFFRLLPDAEEVIRTLAGKYPLVIVSNGFIEVQYEKIRKSGLGDCFSHVVLSEEVGAQKPNPKIYERALELCGFRAEDVLMIGDSWTSDIQGAINAGIDQLWVMNSHVADANLPSTYKVSHLKDVLPMLM